MLGQQNAPRLARNQACTNLLFETLDMQADGRLREAYPARRPGEAAEVAYGCEGPQENGVVQHWPNDPSWPVAVQSCRCKHARDVCASHSFRGLSQNWRLRYKRKHST